MCATTSGSRGCRASSRPFTSPAPLLRRGGHSQAWDPPAEWLGGFFGRLLLAVDYDRNDFLFDTRTKGFSVEASYRTW